jgi:hypothetical protein
MACDINFTELKDKVCCDDTIKHNNIGKVKFYKYSKNVYDEYGNLLGKGKLENNKLTIKKNV